MKGVAVGAGYFSGFHLDAWRRIGGVDISALCDLDEERRESLGRQHGIAQTYADLATMLDRESPDFLDIITRPETHLELCRVAAERGIDIICQKPLAPTFAEAEAIVDLADEHNVRLIVHENFRFQPWYRAVAQLLQVGTCGRQIQSLFFRCRLGDGWGPDAYAKRQPYFRTMPRLLVYETGIHFIDTFRYLGGDIVRVFARLRRFNSSIVGEDSALLHFDFADGGVGTWDADRYHEPIAEDPRYTFGELLLETEAGSIRLYPDGRITLQALGRTEIEFDYRPPRTGFAGDCCYAAQQHFVEALREGRPAETEGEPYLRNLVIQEACYESHHEGRPVDC